MNPSNKAPRPPAVKMPPARRGARLRVSPSGPGDRLPRDYLIVLELVLPDAERTDPGLAGAQTLAVRALSGVSSTTTATDGPTLVEIRSVDRIGKDGVASTTVIGVEAAVLCAGWPEIATIAAIRAELAKEGYDVVTEERRACAEPGCGVDVLVGGNRREETPPSWYSAAICGRHNYRACPSCGSLLKLISSYSAGPAPSVHCTVCGVMLIEWGGSKVWETELVRSGPTR